MAAQRIIGLLTLTAILCALFAVLAMCRGNPEAAKAKAGETLSDGRTAAAQDASAVRDGNDVANTQTRNEVKDAQDEVRQADPADRDRIARQRLCRLNPGACAS